MHTYRLSCVFMILWILVATGVGIYGCNLNVDKNLYICLYIILISCWEIGCNRNCEYI